MAPYPEMDISAWDYRDQEPVGKNSKDWYRDPADDSVWLFKPVGLAPDVTPDGKDWAEKVAHELAVLFGVPTARVELAVRGDQAGTICRNANPSQLPSQSGALLLSEVDPGFDMRDHDARGHSLEAIAEVLTGVAGPVDRPELQQLSGFGVFSGYLVLDALIGNRDRHSQNWSIVFDDDLNRRLMASYDHGSSLGFSLSDDVRDATLRDGMRFDAFVNRGTAYRFEGGRHTTLVDMAARALGMAGTEARAHWGAQVAAISADNIASVISRTPRMSEGARNFAIKFVSETQRRLHDAISA